MHTLSAGPARLWRRRVSGQSRWLLRPSPALTPYSRMVQWYTMAMVVFPRCIAQCTGLATRPPGNLYASLVFQFVANARGDRNRGVRHWRRAGGVTTGARHGAAAGTDCGTVT